MGSCIAVGMPQLATLLSVVQAQRNSQAALTARVRLKMVRPHPPIAIDRICGSLVRRSDAGALVSAWARARMIKETGEDERGRGRPMLVA